MKRSQFKSLVTNTPGGHPCLYDINPNIRMYTLHTVLYKFPRVLTRRICLPIKGCFHEW